MSGPTIKVKVVRKPSLKLKVLSKFPSSVSASSPLTLDRTGGNFAFGLSVTDLRVTFDSIYAPSGAGAPGGSSNQFQFNSSGSFAGSSILQQRTISSKPFVGVGDNIADAISRWGGNKMPLVTTDRLANWTLINDQSFSDWTTLAPPDGTLNQYCSFSSNLYTASTFNFDHMAAFEDLMKFNGSATLTNQHSFLSMPNLASGTVSNRHGVYVADPSGSATITTNYGIRITAQTKGATNWAIMTEGTTPSQFGGSVFGTKVGAGSIAGFVATNSTLPGFGWSMTSNGTDLKNWDAVTTATDLRFRAVTDNNLTASSWMTVTRGSGATVSAVAIPNLNISSVAVSAGQYPGETSTNNATAGNVGEIVSSTVAIGSAASITTATPANITSITLPAGDWDIRFMAYLLPDTTTNVTRFIVSIGTTSATLNVAAGFFNDLAVPTAGMVLGNVSPGLNLTPVRVSLSTSTTYFLVAQSSFTVSTAKVFGLFSARRAR